MLKHRLVVLLVLAVTVSGCAAGRAYRQGQEAERLGEFDRAVAEYTRAIQEDPTRAEFKISLERATQNAARAHISKAHELEQQNQLDGALLEYRKAVDLDPTNRLAAARAAQLDKQIRDKIEASRPKPAIEKMREEARAQSTPLLNPASREPIKLNFNNASLKDILNFLGTQSGINITYDPTWRDKAYTITLEGVTLEEALQQILTANQSFYKVVNPKTILVADDTAPMHQKYDDLVVRVFYLSHADAAEITQGLNTLMRIPTMAVQPAIYPNKTTNTISVRATAQVVEVIERVIRANDRPRAEVVVDVQILEVNRQRAKQLGLNLSQYSLGLTFSPEVAPPNTSPSGEQPANPPPFNLNTITQGISTADFYLSVPTALVKFLEQDSHTKLIAKPQLRGQEGQKLTLNLGDQIPVLSTVFGAAAAGGFASVPQSSFNYKDVGVNISMTPRVTYEGEIILELSVESSALGPSISVAGQDVPSFSSRKVETKLRLREGESNLLAGLLRDEQRKILTGFPGIMRVPVLRSLFGQTNDTVTQSDIVMLLTPHIVRTHELTTQDLAPIYIGTQSNVGLGGPPPLIAPQPATEPAPATGLPSTAPAGATAAAPSGLANPPGGVPPTNPPVPPGTSPVPTLVSPIPVPPTGPPAVAPVPGVTPPAGTTPPTTPPRDISAPPATPPGTPPPATQAQVIVTPPGTEFRVAGGPYTVPISINNASRVSMLTLTVTYNPNVLRVRTAQEGTFMRQGGVAVTFTPRIDASAGRVDIAVARTGDQTGASGAGLLAALIFDAVGPGGSMIQVSGIANTPEGTPIAITFSPVTVTVR